MNTLLDDFSSHVKDVKSLAELYKAMNKVGPLPRYHKKVLFEGKDIKKVTQETEPAVQEAREVCEHARRIAIRLRESNINITLPLPTPEKDPFIDWQRVMEWCLDADTQRHKPEGIEDSNIGYIKKNYFPFGFSKMKWQFVYKGKEAFVDAYLKGLALIEYLILNKNKEFTPLDLLKAVGQREKSETESEKIYSAKDIKEIKKAIEGLEGRARVSTDPQEKERFEQEIKKSKRELEKASNYKGKSRKFSEKYTKSVSRNIDTVLEKIQPQHPELYNHLNTFLNRGEICWYKPDTEIFWEIN